MTALDRPSPRPYIWLGYAIILVTFGMAGGWAATARLDSGVIAPGTVSLEGNRRVIQHLEGGIVAAILVREGERVAAGDVLLRMSTLQARANLDLLAQRHAVLSATERRLNAERDPAGGFAPLTADDIAQTTAPPDPAAGPAAPDAAAVISLAAGNPGLANTGAGDLAADRPSADAIPANAMAADAIPAAVVTPQVAAAMADQRDMFEDRRALLASQTDIMAGRIEQLNAQIAGLEIQRSAYERRLAIQSGLIGRYRIGGEKGVIEQNILAQREDEFIQLETALGSAVTEIARVRLAVNETRMQVLQIRQEYRERASAELREVRRERAEVEERITVARDVLARTEVRAPAAGTVQNVQVITAGSVVGAGMMLMEIVPAGEQLIITASVAPQDIDSVAAGLLTEVKFTGIHDRTAGLAFGRVQSVSRDVITPQNPMQGPYYLARIAVDDADVPAELRARIVAGMPVDVMISTGERTAVQYLVDPLMDTIRKSMREE